MDSSIVIVSSAEKQNHKKIAQRLIFHLKQKEERQKIQSKKILQNCFRSFVLAIQSFWNKIIPLAIRGSANQYQILIQHLENQYHQNQRLIKQSIDQFFDKSNQKYLAVICYDANEINQFKSTFQSLDSLTNIKIAPLNINSSFYKEIFQFKIESSYKCVLLICKGLFDEIFILKTIYFGDSKISNKIINAIKMREQYEQSIKNEMQGLQREVNNSSSQSSIHQIQINLKTSKQKQQKMPKSKKKYRT